MKTLRFLLAVSGLALAVAGLAAGQAGAAGQAAAAGGQPAAVVPQFVILDTDIGDDIDDAFALALALRSPELRLLGITTEYGDTELRAQLVDRFLAAVERFDIPVAAGDRTSANNAFTQAAYARSHASTVCSRVFLTNRPESSDLCPPGGAHEYAVELLLDQIRDHPGEITLIAIGPLFSVQAAIERDPETFRKLKRVVMMGGSIYRGYDGKNGEQRPPDAEWNISRDPAGLRALLASGVPVFMMPLDSTQIHLETGEREAIFSHGSPLTDQLTLLYHQWLAGTEGHPAAPTLFDPVAVAYAVHPELCPATPMRLEVDDKGFTRPVDGPPNAEVCLKSDEKGFLEFLLGRIARDDAH
jgi:inosine-uridine nucleoside N-ribohydrolase